MGAQLLHDTSSRSAVLNGHSCSPLSVLGGLFHFYELAHTAGVTIEHLAKSHIRKEDIVARVIARRGDYPGLVHVY
jgi:hypothetical protein